MSGKKLHVYTGGWGGGGEKRRLPRGEGGAEGEPQPQRMSFLSL